MPLRKVAKFVKRSEEPTTIYVGPRSIWENPWRVGGAVDPTNPLNQEIVQDMHQAYDLYAAYMAAIKAERPDEYTAMLEPLIGYDLSCTCPFNIKCHGDHLIDLVADLAKEQGR